MEHEPGRLIGGNCDVAAIVAVDRPVIVGHQPLVEPIDGGHVIALDSGAGTVADGRLTAVLLPERRFVTAGETPSRAGRWCVRAARCCC